MIFALFFVSVGLLLGAFVWVPITIRAQRASIERETERRVRFAMRHLNESLEERS